MPVDHQWLGYRRAGGQLPPITQWGFPSTSGFGFPLQGDGFLHCSMANIVKWDLLGALVSVWLHVELFQGLGLHTV